MRGGRPAALGGAGALLALLALAPGLSDTARAAGPEPSEGDRREARIEAITQADQELRGLGVQLDGVSRKVPAARAREERLAAKVEDLKKQPRGVMRDVQLQDALRQLRGAIAEERRLKLIAFTLNSQMRTSRVTLAEDADDEARRLVTAGEEAVKGGDDEAGWRLFEDAFGLLTLARDARLREETLGARFGPQVVMEKPDRNLNLALRGDETPDEKRELALILEDAADRTRYNAGLWVTVLQRLKAERATVEDLLALGGKPSEARAEVLTRLNTRIDEVRADIARRRSRQVRLLADSAIVARQAAQEERQLMMEAVANTPPEAKP